MRPRVAGVLLALVTLLGAGTYVTMGHSAMAYANTLAVAGYLVAFFGATGLVVLALTTRGRRIAETFDEPFGRE